MLYQKKLIMNAIVAILLVGLTEEAFAATTYQCPTATYDKTTKGALTVGETFPNSTPWMVVELNSPNNTISASDWKISFKTSSSSPGKIQYSFYCTTGIKGSAGYVYLLYNYPPATWATCTLTSDKTACVCL